MILSALKIVDSSLIRSCLSYWTLFATEAVLSLVFWLFSGSSYTRPGYGVCNILPVPKVFGNDYRLEAIFLLLKEILLFKIFVDSLLLFETKAYLYYFNTFTEVSNWLTFSEISGLFRSLNDIFYKSMLKLGLFFKLVTLGV